MMKAKAIDLLCFYVTPDPKPCPNPEPGPWPFAFAFDVNHLGVFSQFSETADLQNSWGWKGPLAIVLPNSEQGIRSAPGIKN